MVGSPVYEKPIERHLLPHFFCCISAFLSSVIIIVMQDEHWMKMKLAEYSFEKDSYHSDWACQGCGAKESPVAYSVSGVSVVTILTYWRKKMTCCKKNKFPSFR